MLRVRYAHPIPRFLRVQGIVLYPYVLFAPPRERVSLDLIRHEMVHVRQVRKLGWLRFYWNYLFEYAQHLLQLKSHDDAYYSISFEREAFAKQKSLLLTQEEEEALDGKYRPLPGNLPR